MQGLSEIRAANRRATRYRGTNADVAMVRVAAYDEGFRDGYSEGFDEGMAQGKAQANTTALDRYRFALSRRAKP